MQCYFLHQINAKCTSTDKNSKRPYVANIKYNKHMKFCNYKQKLKIQRLVLRNAYDKNTCFDSP